jgi:hypothetical protein
MQALITGFVGLDAHAESTAIAVAEVGRTAPRFVGTVGARIVDREQLLSPPVDTSGPYQALANSSLNAFLRIFPTLVLGSSVLKYTCFGTLYPESDWRL